MNGEARLLSGLRRVLITPDRPVERPLLGARITRALRAGATGVFLREKSAADPELLSLAREIAPIVRAHGAFLAIHDRPAIAAAVEADAVHLSFLQRTESLPKSVRWRGVSIHDENEAAAAIAAGAHYLMLGPVHFTPKAHGPVRPLGWDRFREIAKRSPVPVLAVGGLGPDDVDLASQNGAAGIAAIRAFAD